MKYWNIHDDELLTALRLSRIPSLDFEPGRDGGVATYRQKRLLGVWVELQRERYDFFPAAHLEPTHRSCTIEQVLHVCSWLAAETAIETAPARKAPARDTLHTPYLVPRPEVA